MDRGAVRRSKRRQSRPRLFGFSPGGEAAARRRLMRGAFGGLPVRELPPQSRRPGMPGPYRVASPSRAAAVRSALIRPCRATFSLRAKSRLRRLRSDTRLRAQPLGGRLWGVTAPSPPPGLLTRQFGGYTRRCGRPHPGPPRQNTDPRTACWPSSWGLPRGHRRRRR